MLTSDLIFHPSSLIYGTPLVSTPLVSIAIPTYKRPSLLRQAIGSALSQCPYSPYEVIILADDQSPEIFDVVSIFSPSGIVVYQNPTNIGIWGNMNRALDLARGEWVLILPDDDLLVPDALQKFERILLSYGDQDIGCLAGGVELLFADNRRPLLGTRQSRIHFPVGAKLYSTNSVVCVTDDMCFADIPKLCSSFFRKEYIKQIGGLDAECHGYADVALLLRVQKYGKLCVCREVFGRFRVHEGNLSHPGKLWQTYPVHAAHRLLSHYADETTTMGRSIRLMVERSYTSALWKNRYTSQERKAYAEELLQLLKIHSLSRRFLLRNVWLIDLLGCMYAALRPRLGWLLQRTVGLRRRAASAAE